MPFKIRIDGLLFIDHTTGAGDFRVEQMDDEVLLMRSDAVTYDIPVYSRLFVMREAWIVMANPENKY